MKQLILVALLFVFVACNGDQPPVCEGDSTDPPAEDCVWLGYPDCTWDCPPPPPPPPVCDFEYLKENCEHGVLRLKCECAPPPDTAPPADPADYLRLSRIDPNGGPEQPNDILFWKSHKWQGLYAYSDMLTWQGERDINFVLRFCPWAFPSVMEMTKEEAEQFTVVSLSLNQETGAFKRKMWIRDEPDNSRNLDGTPKPNRRCDPENKNYDTAFLDGNGDCTRSNVRKEVFNDYKDRLLPQIDESENLRGLAQECRNDLPSFDSISGWCTNMNEAGHVRCQ